MNTENCAKRVDTRRFRLRYRTEKSDKKNEFWGVMLTIWYMFKWCYPNYSLREFSEYFELPLTTVSRRFSHVMTWIYGRETGGDLNHSIRINKTLDSLATKNDWHTIRLIWLYESARQDMTKKQFCEKYGVSYNTVRPHLADRVLGNILHVGRFHRYVYFDGEENGWLYPISEPAREAGLMERVLSEFRANWG